MIEVVFTKDYATYKAKDTAFFKKNLVSMLLKVGAVKIKDKKKVKK